MTRKLVAVFASAYVAKLAVRELRHSGFAKDMIDIKSCSRWNRPDETGMKHPENGPKQVIKSEVSINGPRAGMQVGVMIGSAIGAGILLLGMIGGIHLPEMPAITSPAGLAASSLILCMLTGRLLGGAIDLGIPEHEIREYAKNVREGQIEVSVLADWNSIEMVTEILGKQEPLDLQEKPILSRFSSKLNPPSNTTYFDKQHRENK